MIISKKLSERTIYVILLINIFITLIFSSLIMSFRGLQNHTMFFFENDPEFVLAILLTFVLLYPLFFLLIYLVVFIIQLLIKD